MAENYREISKSTKLDHSIEFWSTHDTKNVV